ncbi:MAG: stage III sporulation protein AF [Oscillospiraceae bacterium]
MMAAVRAWLTGVIAASLLVAVAESLIPEGAIRKIARFTGGLILLLTLLQPVLQADVELLLPEGAVSAALADRQAELTAENQAALTAGIEERTAAYIWDKAAALGIDCTVCVTAEPGADGVPLPFQAALDCPWSAELAQYMETELGILPENQSWKGT